MRARALVGITAALSAVGLLTLVVLTGHGFEGTSRPRSLRTDPLASRAAEGSVVAPTNAPSSRTEGTADLAPGRGTARISVRDERSGPERPLRREPAVVQLWRGEEDPQAIEFGVVAEGAFTFEDLEPGRYLLETTDGTIDPAGPFELAAGETLEVVLKDEAQKRVAVAIGFVDAEGSWIDVAPWRVEIEFPRHAAGESRRVGSSSTVVLGSSRSHAENVGRSPTRAWLDPSVGSVNVTGTLERIDALHYLPAHRVTVEVELRPGATPGDPLEVRLPLPPPDVYARVTGRLPRRLDRMNRRVAVRGTSPDGARVVRAFSTDAEGRFEFQVRPDAFAGPQIWFSDPAGRRRSRAYAIHHGEHDLGDIVFE
ncbi:MAG: hypothetical protein AAGB93_16300 [Planctomycetota bacterium]